VRATIPNLLWTAVPGVVAQEATNQWAHNTSDSAQTSWDFDLSPSSMNFDTGERYRIVAYSLRLRYIGAELTKKGVFVGAHDFDLDHATNANTSMVSTPSVSQLQDCPVYEMNHVDDGIEVCYKPYDNSYLEFNKANSSVSHTDTKWFAPYTIVAGLIGGEANVTNLVICEQHLTVEYVPSTQTQDKLELSQFFGNPSVIAALQKEDIIKKIDQWPYLKKKYGLGKSY
jgi:hypothetical protein